MKTLLRLIIGVTALFIAVSVTAQVPQKINYQGVARSASGDLLMNQTISLKLSVRDLMPTGTNLFVETHQTTTNAYGVFSVELGGGTVLQGSFSTIPWGSGAKYLNVQMDPSGGTSYVDLGSTQILSVAYAQYAKDVLNNNDADADPTNELQTLSIAGNQLSISSGNTVTIPAGAPGGNNGDIQFNNGGVFGGDDNLFWHPANKRLGIGTTNPGAALEVLTNSYVNYPHILLNENEADYSRLSFQNTLTPNRVWTVAGITNTTDNNSLMNFYYYNGTSGNDIMTINGSGLVGIGTYTPAYKLTINGGMNSSDVHLVTTASGLSGTDGLRVGMSSGGLNAWVWNYENGKLYFGTNNVERLSILSNGNVGIGTTSPNATLQVVGTTQIGSAGFAFTEIMEVTGTTSASNNFIAIGYPSGYTMSNIRILSLDINYNGNAWVGLGGTDFPTSDIQKVFYYLTSSQIYIYYPNVSAFQNRSFRMIVMKTQ